MSLLLLKTRDLTWQDHTLNTEVMLAPTRSGLLLNKHKTLGAKCEMDKQLYERQRKQCQKDFLTARRLIDRQRQRLVQRQRELDTKHVRSSSVAGHVQSEEQPEHSMEALKERSASAPTTGPRGQLGLPVIAVTSESTSPDPSDRSSGIFVTELAEPFPLYRQSRDSIGTTISAPAEVLRKNSRANAREPFPGTHKKSPVPPNHKPSRDQKASRDKGPREAGLSRGSKGPRDQPVSRDQNSKDKKVTHVDPQHTPRSTVRRMISVRFPDQEDEVGESDDNDNDKVTIREPTLEEKVRMFIADVDNFSRQSHTEREATRDAWLTLTKRRHTDVKVPIVARRYNTWQVDHDQLLKAFDEFCQQQSLEELTRAMRLAAKMKAGVKVTRNQSIIPTIATFKSTRAFKSLLNRQTEQPAA